MFKAHLVAITAAQIVGSRARHGYDPCAPELISEAVDQAEAIVAEIEKRKGPFELEPMPLDQMTGSTPGGGAVTVTVSDPAPTPRAR